MPHVHDETVNTTISGFSSVVEVVEKLDSRNRDLDIFSRDKTFDDLRLELLKEIRVNKTTLLQTVVELAENARRTDEYHKLLESLLYDEIRPLSAIQTLKKHTLGHSGGCSETMTLPAETKMHNSLEPRSRVRTHPSPERRRMWRRRRCYGATFRVK